MKMEEELQQYLNLFEKLVDERTAALVTINERLQQEIAERRKTEETLTHICRELMAKTAESETANEELFQYTYAVSHDLRTPLRAIRNYADFLREDLGSVLENEHQNHLNGLCRAVHDAENLVDGLVQLSQIGRRSVSIETIEVETFLRKLIAALNFPNEVEWVVARDLPTIEAEPVLLQQIFQNLIDNAIIFNESSHKLVEIGWRAVDKKYKEKQI